MSTDETSRIPASEQTPLLRDDPANAGPPEGQKPVAEEPSTQELLVILCSIWLGVFLAALGMDSSRDAIYRQNP
jgi:hypothetical protein